MLPGFRIDATEIFRKFNNTANDIIDALTMGTDLTELEAENARVLYAGHEHQVRFLHHPFVYSEMLKK